MLTACCVSAARKWSRPDVNQSNRVFLRISRRYGVPVPYQRPNPRRAAWGLQIARLAALVLVLAPDVALAQTSDPTATTAEVGAEDARNSFTIVGTVTFANGSIEGDTFDRRLFLAGIRYSRILINAAVLLCFGYVKVLTGS
jgi:hypothetical protein